MRIDIHSHAFPDALAGRALRELTERTRPYQSIYGVINPYTDATVRGLLASSKAAGLDVSAVMPIATSPHPSQTLNDFAAAADKLPGLRSFGSVHPRNPDAMKELERVKALGLRGIKLHPEYQDCYADDPDSIAVVRKAAELGLWVLFHAGRDIGIHGPVHCAPEHAARLREAVPDAHIILAHLGGFNMWEEVEEALPSLTGFYVDTSSSISTFPDQWNRFARLIRTFGADHVLFGTDSPWDGQTKAVEATERFFEKYAFSQGERNAIFGGNAAKILGDTGSRI